MTAGTRAMLERFWQAWAGGELLLQRCDACRRLRGYPRPLCPVCSAAGWQWEPATGRGTVYSFTRVPRRDAPPATVVLVELEEGVRVLGAWDADELPAIGLPARARTRGRAEGPLAFA